MANSRNRNRLLILLLGALLNFPLLGFQSQDDPEADQYFRQFGDFAASHIVIAYKGADRARETVTRSKKEALEKATSLADQLSADPSAFEALAKAHSDGPSASSGGLLPVFRKGTMAPAFESALRKLEEGAITPEPVKTPFGYHIIQRHSLVTKQFSGRILLFTHSRANRVKGLKEGSPGFTRDKQDSEREIRALVPQLTPENFDAMALKHSDMGGQNGYLGVFKKGDSALINQIIGSIENLPYEGISDILELSIGYAVIKRLKVQRLAGAQILITHLNSDNSPSDVLRIRKEAKALAEKICRQLQKDPKKFARLAKKHSDDVFSSGGGKLPKWYFGSREPAFDNMVMSMAPGDITPEPLETSAGFYIIRRDPLK